MSINAFIKNMILKRGKNLNKTIKGYFLGVISAAVLLCGVVYAANTTTLYNVLTDGVKIVVDGQKINPTDANGNAVEPIIYNGTTYLPVRAVANAFGKEVYWDGPNYTVYLGSMNGTLDYASKELTADDSIGLYWWNARSSALSDNYGNSYSRAIYPAYDDVTFEYLCNYKYSRLKGTIYICKGCSESYTTQIIIKTDGKTVYTSPEIDKTTAPIPLDINITGCNDLQIIATENMRENILIGELGLYQ